MSLHSKPSRIAKEISIEVRDVEVIQGLEHLGYKQEMTRSRGLFHLLFMTLAIVAVPYSLIAPIATSLIGGGPATILWGWVTVSILTQPLAFSLAEISSKYPTSAAAYYWCFRLSSPRFKLVSSWINGWLTMVGVWTASLSVAFGTAQLIVAGAGIFHPDWITTPWQTYLIFMAVTAIATVTCLFFNGILPMIDIVSACWTILGILVMLVCLLAKAATGHHSVQFALGHFDPSASGWSPGWTFFLGLLPPAYTYAGIGMITSMSEEARNPSVDVPKAIVWSVPIGAVCGLFFLLPIVFTLPNVATILAVTSGQPVGLMLELIMGSKGGGFGLWFIIFGTGMFCTISISCAASRSTWAFSRDKAIPFHRAFSRVSTSLDIPLNAYLLSTAVQLLLGLLYLGSTAAFNAFAGVAVICLGASYTMPVVLLLANGRRDIADAPFKLGKWGWILNSVAVLWTLLEIVLFCMPVVIPVTKVSMNYASAVFIGFAIICAASYLTSGRLYYAGPPIPVDGPKNISTRALSPQPSV